MALIVAENGGGALTQPKAQQIEERLIAKVVQLITGILRLGVTQTADCYDPRALEKHLPQVIELVGVIAAKNEQLAAQVDNARASGQEDLACVDVSRQTINALETGKYDPSLPLAFKIAASFGKPIEEIFEPDDDAS